MPLARLLPLHLLGTLFLAPLVRFRCIVDRSEGRRGVLRTPEWRGMQKTRRVVVTTCSLVTAISLLEGSRALLVARGSGLARQYVRSQLSSVRLLLLVCLIRIPVGVSLLGGISVRFPASAGYSDVLAILVPTRISSSSVSCVLLCFALSHFPYLLQVNTQVGCL